MNQDEITTHSYQTQKSESAEKFALSPRDTESVLLRGITYHPEIQDSSRTLISERQNSKKASSMNNLDEVAVGTSMSGERRNQAPEFIGENIPSDSNLTKTRKGTTFDHKLDHIKSLRRNGTMLYRHDLKELSQYYKSNHLHDAREDDADNRMTVLARILETQTREERFEKAARHLRDGLFLRRVRNDFDIHKKRVVKTIYEIQTNPHWQSFLGLLGWCYMMLCLVEPSYSNDLQFLNDPNDFRAGYHSVRLALEICFVTFFWIDLIMSIWHRCYDRSVPRFRNLVGNKKMFFKQLINIAFVIDIIHFNIVYPKGLTVQFSRYLRPICVLVYSRQLRRTLMGIVGSFQRILDVIIFFLIIALVYALIGWRILGPIDYDGLSSHDQEVLDSLVEKYGYSFNDLGNSFNTMYLLLDLDGYPYFMISSLRQSYLYLIYFIPYVLACYLLLMPIPTAMLFEAFRNQRGKQVIRDRIKEREALFASFVSIDIEKKMQITKNDFHELLRVAFGRNASKKKLNELFEVLDLDRDENLQLDEFFELPELINSSKIIYTLWRLYFTPWHSLRACINKLFKLDRVSVSIWFERLMLLVVLAYTGILIAYTAVSDPKIASVLNNIDNYFVYIYVAEVVIRVFGLGIQVYWDDNWNKLDLILTIISLIVTVALPVGKLSKILGVARGLRLLRLIRLKKIVILVKRGRQRGRSNSFSAVFDTSIKSLDRIRKFFQKIILCIPMVIKLFSLTILVTYDFALAGVELFHSDFQIKPDEYGEKLLLDYTNFDYPWMAAFSLLHVITRQGWDALEKTIEERYNRSTYTIDIYFGFFDSISNIILISLIQGMVWEVFTIVDRNFDDREKIDDIITNIERKATILQQENFHIRSKQLSKSMFSLNELEHLSQKSFDEVDEKKDEKSKNEKNRRRMSLDVAEVNTYLNSLARKPSDKKVTKRNEDVLSELQAFAERTPRMSPFRELNFDLNRAGSVISEENSSLENVSENLESCKIDASYADERYDSNYLKELVSDRLLNTNRTQTKEIELTETERATGGVVSPDLFIEEMKQVAKSKQLVNRTAYTVESPFNKNSMISKRIMNTMTLNKQTEFDEIKIELFNTYRDSEEGTYLHSPQNNPTEREVSIKKLKKDLPKISTLMNQSIIKRTSKFLKNVGSAHTVEFIGVKASQIGMQKSEVPYSSKSFSNVVDVAIQAEEKSYYSLKITLLSKFEKELKIKLNIPNLSETLEEDGSSSTPEYKNLLSSKSVYSQYRRLELGIKTEEENTLSTAQISEGRAFPSRLLLQKKKQKMAKQTMTEHAMLRKALLKNANMKAVENYENNYFTKIYGNLFGNFRSKKSLNLSFIYDLESRLLTQLLRISRDIELPSMNFADLLYQVEVALTRSCISKGSVAKFLFKTADNRWLIVTQSSSEEKASFQFIKDGPWNHSEHLFEEKNQIYFGRDMTFCDEFEKFKQFPEKLMDSLNQMSASLPGCKLSEMNPEVNIWDMFAVRVTNDSLMQTNGKLMQLFGRSVSTRLTKLRKYVITECMFVSFNMVLQLRTTASNKAPVQEKLTLHMDSNETHNRKPERMDSLLLDRRSTTLDDNSLGGLSKSDKGEDEKDCLPMSEYVEFIKDIRDVLCTHKETIFLKISQFFMKKCHQKANY